MSKKYVVRLTEAECEVLEGLIQNKRRRVSAQKVQRARILLKANADGPDGATVRSPRRLTVARKPLKRFGSAS